VVVRPVGDPVEKPGAPRRGVGAVAGNRAKRRQQIDHGRSGRLDLVGSDVLQEPAVVTPGDGEPAAEALADGEDVGHRQVRRPIRHGPLVVAEAVGRVVDSQMRRFPRRAGDWWPARLLPYS